MWLVLMDMCIWRRVEKIGREDDVLNEEILRRVGKDSEILKTKRWKKQWTIKDIKGATLLRTAYKGQ